MNTKTKKAIAVVSALVAVCLLFVFATPKCVSEAIGAGTLLKDSEREMCLAASSGKNLEYWIDGERSTPGSNWHLEHVECRWSTCLYRCRETEALWRLSSSGKFVEMEKADKSATLPQKYRFEVPK